MADDEFSISIGIHADLAPFKSELRAGLEEAAKGVTIPVRAGGIPTSPGGQGSRVSTAYSAVSAADQLAVDAAFNRMRDTPARGGGYASGGAPGGWAGAFTPTVDTSKAFDAFFRIEKRFQAAEKFISAVPIKVNVDVSHALASLASVEAAMRRAGLGGGGHGGVPLPGGGGGGLPVGASSPNWSYLLSQRGAGGGLPFGASSPNWANYFKGIEDQLGALAPTSSPNWSYLLSQRAAGGAPSPSAPSRWSLSRFNLRSLVGGALGLHELNTGVGSIREGEASAALARTPEEAQLARAQSLQQATSGIFGSAAFLIPNLLDASFSPQRILREAREAAELRQRSDTYEKSRLGTAVEMAARRGFDEGGTTQANLARLQAEETAETVPLARRAEQLKRDLASRVTRDVKKTFAYSRAEEQDEFTGAVRSDKQQELIDTQERIENAKGRTKAGAEQIKRDVFARQAAAEDRIALDKFRLSTGTTARDIAQASLRNQFRAQAFEDVERDGAAGYERNRAEFSAASAAQTAGFRRADFETGRNTVAALLGPDFRNFQQRQIGLSGQAAQFTALLNRDPLGAQLAGIQAQRAQALAGTTPGVLGFFDRLGINRNAALQTQLAQRDFSERREDIGTSLESETRQSGFRTLGGRFQVDAAIDRIVSTTARESLALERAGDPVNAQRRRRLGSQQLDESRADFYRSIRYQEVSGADIATRSGRSPTDNIDRKFRDADDKIAKGAGDQGGSDSAPPSKSQMDQALGFLRDLATKFTSRAS